MIIVFRLWKSCHHSKSQSWASLHNLKHKKSSIWILSLMQKVMLEGLMTSALLKIRPVPRYGSTKIQMGRPIFRPTRGEGETADFHSISRVTISQYSYMIIQIWVRMQDFSKLGLGSAMDALINPFPVTSGISQEHLDWFSLLLQNYLKCVFFIIKHCSLQAILQTFG